MAGVSSGMPNHYSGFRLSHPLFLSSLLVLLLNDYWLKYAFQSALTGKLSDFSGLLVLAWLLSSFQNRWAVWMHTGTAWLFVFWKMPISSSFIEYLQQHAIPVHRVVDPSDLWALIILPISYFIGKSSRSESAPSAVRYLIGGVAAIACMATSLPPRQRAYMELNRSYSFSCSKQTLIRRVNSFQLQAINRYGGFMGELSYHADRGIICTPGDHDTLAQLIDQKSAVVADTVYIRTLMAHIALTGNADSSSLLLIRAWRPIPLGGKTPDTGKLIKEIEKQFIRKLNAPVYLN